MMKIQIALARGISHDTWKAMKTTDKKAYVKKHPESKYANAVKNKQDKLKEEKTDEKKEGKIKKHSKKMGAAIGKMNKENKEFFERDGHKPESAERRKFGKFMKDKATGVVKVLKHEVEEWKDAGGAVRKLMTGKHKDITEHEKKALKTVAIHAAMVIVPMAVTGGLSGGLAATSKGLALSLLEHTALLRGAQVAVFASGEEVSDSDALELLIEQMGDAMASADITEDTWIKAAT